VIILTIYADISQEFSNVNSHPLSFHPALRQFRYKPIGATTASARGRVGISLGCQSLENVEGFASMNIPQVAPFVFDDISALDGF